MNITEETKVITAHFHHQFHLYKGFVIILSKEGGIKKLDKDSLDVVWEEKLNGELLSYSFIYENKLFASTTSTFLYSFDLDNNEILEKGTKNLFFNSRSKNDYLIIGKTKNIDNEGKKIKHFGIYDLNKDEFVLKRESSTYRVCSLIKNRLIYSLPSKRNEVSSYSIQDENEWTIDLAKSFNVEQLNELSLIDCYKNNLIFYVKGESTTFIVLIDISNGQLTGFIKVEEPNLKISNSQSFILDNTLYTFSNDKAIQIDLENKSIKISELEGFNISTFLNENDTVYFIDRSRKYIGEFNLKDIKLNWIMQLSNDKNYKAWELFHKEGILYFNDSSDNLIKIKAYNNV